MRAFKQQLCYSMILQDLHWLEIVKTFSRSREREIGYINTDLCELLALEVWL